MALPFPGPANITPLT